MKLPPGSRLGPYEILSWLGAGGMGDVYRARDTRLGRDVAVKILPPAFAANPDRLRRFELEARATSMLNHPNILAIYDVGVHEGSPYIVSELLEGRPLRERLAEKLSLRKAFDLALQIAHGLSAAHAKGVVHRDLKPENVFITGDGRAKILDFGLAKLAESSRGPELAAPGSPSQAPTVPGAILGTAGYMAPEQVRGETADHRADIFAFGAVLYEMVRGRRAFDGTTAVETMNAVLNQEPVETGERPVPAELDRLLRHCLEKSPSERFQSMRDVLFNLEGLSGPTGTSSVAVAVHREGARRRRGIWIVATGLLSLATAALLVRPFREEPPRERVARFVVFPPEGARFPAFPSFLTLSPDGTRLAFVAVTGEGRRLLWIRELDSLGARALPGTEGADQPFWSADGRFVAFFSEGKLRKIDLEGGLPQTICDAPPSRSGAWNLEGVIIFTPGAGVGLYRVAAAGGKPAPLTLLDRSRGENDHLWAHFLPDGRRFLYLARSSEAGKTGIFLGSLDRSERELLLSADSSVAYAAPGYLVYQREGTLLAQPFDAASARLAGEPRVIASEVGYNITNGRGAFSVSRNGVLAYRAGPDQAYTELAWFNRAGRKLGALDWRDANPDPWLSPDEKSVAVSRLDRNIGTDVWLFDGTRRLASRFTFDDRVDSLPIWSPDGTHIAFASNRRGSFDLYQKVATGAGPEELLLDSSNDEYPSDWSSDGRYLAYYSPGQRGDFDLWILPVAGERRPSPLLQTEADERNGRFSPDGRWMAFASNQTGTYEVYVQPLSSRGRWQISTAGGFQPRWRRDGKELFYLAADGKVMAVPVGVADPFEPGSPRSLFETWLDTAALINDRNYAVSADGERFLIATPLGTAAPITVVLNWTAELQRAVTRTP